MLKSLWLEMANGGNEGQASFLSYLEVTRADNKVLGSGEKGAIQLAS
jgi:hypothetical protein